MHTCLIQVVDTDLDSLSSRPDNGCYIRGLFLEGARWDNTTHELSESRPKELYTDMPVMWLIPTANRKPPQSGVYICPVYKTLTRAGMLLLMNDYEKLFRVTKNINHGSTIMLVAGHGTMQCGMLNFAGIISCQTCCTGFTWPC